MFLSVDTIRQNATSATVYRRGQQYRNAGCVLECSYTLNPDGTCIVRATVRGSDVYDVSAHLSRNGYIDDYDCTCPAHQKYAGLCKHCVAALLQARDQLLKSGDMFRTTGGTQSPVVPSHQTGSDAPPVKSSQWVKDLLDEYAHDADMNLMEEPSGQIRLEPVVELTSMMNAFSISLRVGSSRMYLVKNIEDFMNAFKRNEARSYGKSLCFRHCQAALDKESLALYGLLSKHHSANLLWHYKEPRRTEPRLFHLSLSGMNDFFSMYQGQSLPLHYSNVYERIDSSDTLTLITDTPLLSLRVSVTDQQAIELRHEKYTVYWGEQAFYLYRDGKLYPYAGAAAQALTRLTSAMMWGNCALSFSPDDFTAFCSSVLPDIKPYVAFSDPQGLLLRYLPDSMSAHVFLDAPIRNRVVCTLAAEYGGDLFDLATGKTMPRLEPLAESANEENGEPEGPVAEGAMEGGSDDPIGFISSNASTKTDGESASHRRDLSAERLLLRKVAAVFHVDPQSPLAATGDDAMYELMTVGIAKLQAFATVHVSDRLRRYAQAAPVRVNMGVTLDSGLLKMDIDLESFSPEELLAALAAYRERRKYFRLQNGAFLPLGDDSPLDDVAQMADGLQLTDKQLLAGHVEIPAFRAMYLDGLFGEANRGGASLRKDAGFKRLVRTIKSAADSDYAVPAGQKNVLRSYQENGYRWLRSLAECGFCGILADDMGLGKTLQLITLLASQQDEHTSPLPSLIACPASLVLNWQAELTKFAPQLPVRVILGTATAREKLIAAIAPGEIVLTSYDLLKRDTERYQKLRFQTFAIDEAQFIKNQATKSAHAVKEINCAQRFALTGTPIENRLSELWSIFDFLMPGYLFSYNRFRQRFEMPIMKNNDELARAQLKRMIAPFVLRRLKRDVLRELPPKVTTALPVELAEEQRKLYTATLADGLMDLKAQVGSAAGQTNVGETKIKVLALLTRLRQLCCDPSLCYENYTGESAKLESCMELIDEARNGGHKALVFSQFTSMLALLEKRLVREGIAYYLLQGSTPKEERLALADKFNQDNTPVFLISLKAGGTGLNLTGADMVIHYDPWWNLAAQEQATDRAHRIGQTKSLQVYKLIARGTIEEKIVKLQELKGGLASIVDGEGENAFSALSTEEWIQLLEGDPR